MSLTVSSENIVSLKVAKLFIQHMPTSQKIFLQNSIMKKKYLNYIFTRAKLIANGYFYVLYSIFRFGF